MFILTKLFPWAFIGMFGLLVSVALVSGIKLGLNTLFGIITIMI